MPRRKVEPVPAPVEVPVIQPGSVYFVDSLIRTFRLRPASVRREVASGRLPVCKRCGRYYILGEQILAWLRAGEVVRRQAAVDGDRAETSP